MEAVFYRREQIIFIDKLLLQLSTSWKGPKTRNTGLKKVFFQNFYAALTNI